MGFGAFFLVFCATFSVTSAAVCNNTRLELLMVLDSSASICCGTNCNNNPPASCSNYDLMKDFFLQLITAFSPAIDAGDVRTGLLVYSGSTLCYLYPNGTVNYCVLTNIYDQWTLANYSTAADMALDLSSLVKYDGGATYTAAALDHAASTSFSSARLGVNRLTIVVTDGVSSDAANLTMMASNLQASSTVIAVGIVGASQTELQTMATNSVTDAFNVVSFSAVSSVVTQIVQRSCTIAGGTYSNTTLATPGGVSILSTGSGVAALSLSLSLMLMALLAEKL